MQEDRILYDFLQPAEWDLPGEYQVRQQLPFQCSANLVVLLLDVIS